MVTRRRILQAAAALPAAACVPAFAAAGGTLASAPLAGHFTHDSVRLWLQAMTGAAVVVSFWPEQGTDVDARQVEVTLTARNDFSAIIRIGGLTPDCRYRYTVRLDGKPTGLVRIFRTAPAPGAPPKAFRVYLGSCAYTEVMSPDGTPYGDEFQIFDSIAGKMQSDSLPHLMLWLGDNLYLRSRGKFLAEADYASVARMEARYREVRGLPMFQKLFAATQHYAIWDDHDYGPNNSDKSFRFTADALRLFKQYWPNPDMGSRDLPGTWTSFVHQDAAFFLLDDRSYRDGEKAPPADNKVMFGGAQMAWLRQSLGNSKATFKLVCSGSQLLSEDENGHHSGWHSYPAEREPFLAWLAAEKIPGLLFLSGDRHNTQVFRLKQERAPAIYEYSSSPFTSRLSRLSKKDRANPRLVAGLGVEQRNFGTLEVTGSGDSRKIVGACFDSNGRQLWQHTLAGAQTDANGLPA